MPHIDESIPPAATMLWKPSYPEKTQIYDFMTKVSKKYGLALHDYNALWSWSVSEPAKFWEEIWHYTNVQAHQPYDTVSSSRV